MILPSSRQPPSEEYAREASASEDTAETRQRVAADRLRPVHAPVPTAAHQRRPSAGAETTPATTSSPSMRAIKVAHTGTPRT